jgi:hypothetical protein
MIAQPGSITLNAAQLLIISEGELALRYAGYGSEGIRIVIVEGNS